jgi:hypothetical protein
MEILEVGTNAHFSNEFLKLPIRIYRKNPYWIRPLDKDVESVFDPQKNKFFKDGECVRWIAVDSSGQTVGRIAAFYNKHLVKSPDGIPTGSVGFFECANDRKVAFALFDIAKKWLQSKGLEAMNGPVNFGERDRFWGLLIDGYNKEPTYGMDYHLPYYKTLFEEYGFQSYFEQYTFHMPLVEEEVKARLNPKIYERAQSVFETPGFDFRHIKKNQLAKFAEDFRIIYNKAWAANSSASQMTPEMAAALLNRMKPLIEEKLMWFGYYEDQPIAFFIMLPEVNQIFKHVNGKLDIIGKLKFLYHKLMKTNHKVFGIIFGVIPEFQRRGVESAIALAYTKVAWAAPNFQYTEMEMNWVGSFNKKMISFCKLLGGEVVKTHATYRYLFDSTKEFVPHPDL